MQTESPIGQRWQLMREHLNERQRPGFAAAEAKVLGRGKRRRAQARNAQGPDLVPDLLALVDPTTPIDVSIFQSTPLSQHNEAKAVQYL